MRTYNRAQYLRERQFWKYFTIRIDHDTFSDLQAMSKRLGVSQAELVRRYIQWGMLDDEADSSRHGTKKTPRTRKPGGLAQSGEFGLTQQENTLK